VAQKKPSKLRVVPASLLCAAAMLFFAACSTAPSGTDASAEEETTAGEPAALLPDIVPDVPKNLVVEPDDGGNLLLAFDTQFDNLGDGPLVIEAEAAAEDETMEARQSVEHEDGSMREGEEIAGTLRFERSEDHNHWHFFRFMRYELRDTNGEIAAPDQKTGFCVGDRYDADPEVRMEGEPDPPGVFDIAPEGDWCAEDDPGRDELTMGLSVGYGDNYEAFLEGQSIDVTDLPDGRYVLVNRVNADLEETDTENNAASLLIELATDEPTVSVIERCPDSDRCGRGG